MRELEARGVLDARPGRTAGEVARDGGDAVPALAADLARAAAVFDEVWYGGRTADAASYAVLVEVDGRVTGARVGRVTADRDAPGAPPPARPWAATARGLRGPVVLGVLLAVGAGRHGAGVPRRARTGGWSPARYAPAGARALAELLRDRGVDVRRVDTVDAALEGTARTVLLLPAPSSLTAGELARLSARPGELVVRGGAARTTSTGCGAPVEVGAAVPVEPRRPACDLPAARLAGDVELGGATYRADAAGAVGCYASGGRPTLLRLPGRARSPCSATATC